MIRLRVNKIFLEKISALKDICIILSLRPITVSVMCRRVRTATNLQYSEKLKSALKIDDSNQILKKDKV